MTTGKWLAEARGRLSYEEVAYRLRGVKGAPHVSLATIRRMEKMPDDKLNPHVVAGLVAVYGKRISDLPSPMRERVEEAKGLLDALSRCTARVAA